MHIEVSIKTQSLALYSCNDELRRYVISTAKNGVGEVLGSERTPRGIHIIAEKIGDGCAINTVFVGRVPTGEIYDPVLRQSCPDRDWILTRIFWLSGIEAGRNKGWNNSVCVDSHDRYIYIHGAPDDMVTGQPKSRGCIRMHNKDIIDLFNRVHVKTPVFIREH